MTQPQPPYNMADVLQLLGQCTVELAFLRGQIAQLQQRLKELEPELEKTPNGATEILPEHVAG
jgi:hypothetical protein